MPSTIQNDVLRRGIKHRATADRFTKRFAEMTEARISNFCGSFGNVVAAGAQQLSRAFHPQIAQILRDGETDLTRKNPAQIKWTAADFLSEHLQHRRIGQIARQYFLRTLDTLARDALLPHTEKFRVLGHKKKMGH